MNTPKDCVKNFFRGPISTALVFAARYTHSRNTGGTLAVTRALRACWPYLDDSTREQILREAGTEATANLEEWRALEIFAKTATSVPSALLEALCVSGWVRTADRLPGSPDEIGNQTDVLMWSPGWATWLKGMCTRWGDETTWSLHDQMNDRYELFEVVPEFWYEPKPEQFLIRDDTQSSR